MLGISLINTVFTFRKRGGSSPPPPPPPPPPGPDFVVQMENTSVDEFILLESSTGSSEYYIDLE